MATIRLEREASFGLLVADLVVLYFALSVALDKESPTPLRLISFAVATLAVALGAHSVVSITRRTGPRSG